jgi:ABC-type nitrate/sulfonate/bicarbonate transport system substrate-binding protein
MNSESEPASRPDRRRFLRASTLSLCGISLLEVSRSRNEGRSTLPDEESALEISLFRDSTETVLSLAARRQSTNPEAPFPPKRHFVADADEAHLRLLNGTSRVVGMSLDDVIACSLSGHSNAGKVVCFAAVHRGFLKLIARPGIEKIADLRGKRVAVDTDTGYAAALYEILARNGLDRRRDVKIVYAGATNLRYEKLCAGEFDATLLGTPFTVLARRRGFRSLARPIEILGGYQAVVLASLQPWLAENADAARQLVGCIRTTIEWASQPANRTTAEPMLAEILSAQNASDAASEVADELFGAASEFNPDGKIRASDAAVVLQLYNASRGVKLPTDSVARLSKPIA